MVLIAAILAVQPLLTMAALSALLGVNVRTIRRMRAGGHHLTYPQQLHVESQLAPEVVRRLRERWQQPVTPTFWQQRLRS